MRRLVVREAEAVEPEIAKPAQAYRAARDVLLERRTNYDAALRDFAWPELDEFSWALRTSTRSPTPGHRPAPRRPRRRGDGVRARTFVHQSGPPDPAPSSGATPGSHQPGTPDGVPFLRRPHTRAGGARPDRAPLEPALTPALQRGDHPVALRDRALGDRRRRDEGLEGVRGRRVQVELGRHPGGEQALRVGQRIVAEDAAPS